MKIIHRIIKHSVYKQLYIIIHNYIFFIKFITFLLSRLLRSARQRQDSRKNETPIYFSFNEKEKFLFEDQNTVYGCGQDSVELQR